MAKLFGYRFEIPAGKIGCVALLAAVAIVILALRGHLDRSAPELRPRLESIRDEEAPELARSIKDKAEELDARLRALLPDATDFGDPPVERAHPASYIMNSNRFELFIDIREETAAAVAEITSEAGTPDEPGEGDPANPLAAVAQLFSVIRGIPGSHEEILEKYGMTKAEYRWHAHIMMVTIRRAAGMGNPVAVRIWGDMKSEQFGIAPGPGVDLLSSRIEESFTASPVPAMEPNVKLIEKHASEIEAGAAFYRLDVGAGIDRGTTVRLLLPESKIRELREYLSEMRVPELPGSVPNPE